MKKIIASLALVFASLMAETGTFTGETYRTEVEVGYTPATVEVYEVNSSGSLL